MSAKLNDPIVQWLAKTLSLPETQTIDFTFDGVPVNNGFFNIVALSILLRATGGIGKVGKASIVPGIAIEVVTAPAGTEPNYDPSTNAITFPDPNYGRSL